MEEYIQCLEDKWIRIRDLGGIEGHNTGRVTKSYATYNHKTWYGIVTGTMTITSIGLGK